MTPLIHRVSAARGIALALALGGSFAPTSDTHASPPSSDEGEEQQDALGTVHVELRTHTLSSKLTHQLAERLDAEVEDRVAEIGLAFEVTPAADVIVQLEISQPQANMQLYVIQSVAVIEGKVVVRGEVQSCMDCSAAQLLDRGLELLPDLADALSSSRREAEQAVEEAQRATEEAPTAPAPEVEPARDRLLGPMGYVGISTSTLGLGSSIAGAVLLAKGDNVDETFAFSLTIINYRPPGWALVGVGLTALVVGNVLLAVDLARSRRHHRGRSSARITSIGPRMSDAPGLFVLGRF